MKTFALILAFALAGAMADGPHNHRGSHGRSGRGRSFRRRGRQEGAPLSNYGAAAPPPPPPATDYDYADTAAAPLGSYGSDSSLSPVVNGNGGGVRGGANGGAGGDDNLAMLEKAVPGVPGQDYPIFSEVPESGFTCDGQVDGGYYADSEAECQVFHICTADGQGGLAKYSFLCPNGTIFNQNYFICDWWFNFDCAEAEALYSLNEDIAAEREAATAAAGSQGAASTAQASYNVNGNGALPPVAPVEADYSDYDTGAPAPAVNGYGAPDTAPVLGNGNGNGNGLSQYGNGNGREGRNRRFRNNGRSSRRQQSRGRQGRRFQG